ncbi:MAG: recombinase family protein [Steroidobacteraceae bacterium]|jgi:hypothetical protein
MGGVVPLGYRVENRKLLIDEDEVGMVRLIFQRYLELGSLPALQRDLSEKRILTRIRNLSSGRSIGGVPLTNGPLSYILKNRLYLGEINHRKVSYQSDHTPIISIELFEAVQTLLAQNLNRKDMRKGKSGALLTGRLFDACGQLMSPSHTTKKGVRYRYYVTAAIAQGRKKEAGMIIRLPAQEIETIVLENLRKLALISMDSDGQSRIEQFGIIGLRVDVCDRTLELSWIERKRNPQQRETSVAITEADNVSASVAADENDDASDTLDARRRILVPYVYNPHKRRREIVLPANGSDYIKPIEYDEQQRLIRSIAQGRAWLREILGGTTTSIIAAREHKSERAIRLMLSLAFLDPKLVKAALHGNLPRGISSKRLIGSPANWHDQWRTIGLSRPA